MAEKDYISREAAIDALDSTDWYHQNVNKNMVHGANPTEHQAWYREQDVYSAINSIPAADVREVVRGKWVDGKGNPVPWDDLDKDCPAHSCYCSVCGDWLSASDEYLVKGRFCPNCGADMRGTR